MIQSDNLIQLFEGKVTLFTALEIIICYLTEEIECPFETFNTSIFVASVDSMRFDNFYKMFIAKMVAKSGQSWRDTL